MSAKRLRDRVDRAAQPEVGERLGLRLHALGLGGRQVVLADRLAGGAHDQELAQVRQEVTPELGDVAARAREALAGLQGGAPVPAAIASAAARISAESATPSTARTSSVSIRLPP